MILFPGDSEQLFDFEENPPNSEQLQKDFIVTADSVWGEGYSWATLDPGSDHKSINFCGELNTTTPKDGRTARAGYVNIKSASKFHAFGRKRYLDFEYYDAVTLRVRGDGRAYSFNIHLDEEIDISWMDLYMYPLYTRGGPYWQDVVIPFSKFILTHRGAIQDKQTPFDREEVINFSITLADRVNGPFNLEIAKVGLLKQNLPLLVAEKTAYETYKMPHKLFLGSELT